MKGRRPKIADEKKRKEIAWFMRKYIQNDENFPFFVRQLSPADLTEILKACLKMGMVFTWDDDPELFKRRGRAQRDG